MTQEPGRPAAPSWRVVCLCAGWCGVCHEYQPLFDRVAAQQPQVRFDWVDIEDEAEAMGDVDVETFPTLLIAHGTQVHFFGPVPPTAEQLARLLSGLRRADAPGNAVPAESVALYQRLLASALADRS